ncbi:MAG: hypothetical protein ACP5LD_09920, partial [Desulfomonilaceae bacterium]
RQSMRVQGYNYSQVGAYCVTVCAHDRSRLLGEIVDGEMRLNEAGFNGPIGSQNKSRIGRGGGRPRRLGLCHFERREKSWPKTKISQSPLLASFESGSFRNDKR